MANREEHVRLCPVRPAARRRAVLHQLWPPGRRDRAGQRGDGGRRRVAHRHRRAARRPGGRAHHPAAAPDPAASGHDAERGAALSLVRRRGTDPTSSRHLPTRRPPPRPSATSASGRRPGRSAGSPGPPGRWSWCWWPRSAPGCCSARATTNRPPRPTRPRPTRHHPPRSRRRPRSREHHGGAQREHGVEGEARGHLAHRDRLRAEDRPRGPGRRRQRRPLRRAPDARRRTRDDVADGRRRHRRDAHLRASRARDDHRGRPDQRLCQDLQRGRAPARLVHRQPAGARGRVALRRRQQRRARTSTAPATSRASRCPR